MKKKNFVTLFFVALFATMTLILPSCSKDDDPKSADITGTWECVSSFTDDIDWGDLEFGDDSCEDTKSYVRFADGGKYTEVIVEGDDVDVSEGTWTRSGDKITIKGDGIITYTAGIVEITNNTLTLELMGFTVSYKKVPDSTIDKYLD